MQWSIKGDTQWPCESEEKVGKERNPHPFLQFPQNLQLQFVPCTTFLYVRKNGVEVIFWNRV